MTHSGARDFLVHRQYELAPPPSPPEESAAERMARLSKPLPPPSPPAPPAHPPPEMASFVAEDLAYKYDGREGDGPGGGAVVYVGAGEAGSSRVHALYEHATELPASWWLGGGAAMGACLLLCVCVGFRTRARRRRRRAQLEDVQTVMHTETWRKLE